MKRYTQEKIENMYVGDLLRLAETGKCQLDEQRVIVEETYETGSRYHPETTLYVVKFCYTLTFPEMLFYDQEQYYVEVIDGISFEKQTEAEDYIAKVRCPSNNLGSRYQVFLKDEYADAINSLVPHNWHIEADTKSTCNMHRCVFDKYYWLYIGDDCDNLFHSFDEIITGVRIKYDKPKSTKNIVEVTEKRYNTVDIDELIEDVEKLKNEKNAFIADEIKRSTQYIITLKKFL